MRMRVLLAVIAVSAWLALPGPGRADDSRSDRARAWDALRSKLPEARYLRHSVAVEAIMREMAVPGTDNADQRGLAGLLHDIDIGETASDLSRHGVVGAQILRDLSFNAAVIHAVNAHDDRAGVARTSRLDHAVYCADQVYWLVAATGLSFPSDKLHTAFPATVWEPVQAGQRPPTSSAD